MAHAAPRACRKVGCQRLVRKGFCEDHRREERRELDERRGTRQQRGYDEAWLRLRARYIKAHPLCVMCRAEGTVMVAEVVDHIVPISAGGARLDESNLQALCATHHNSTKQRLDRQRGRVRPTGGE